MTEFVNKYLSCVSLFCVIITRLFVVAVCVSYGLRYCIVDKPDAVTHVALCLVFVPDVFLCSHCSLIPALWSMNPKDLIRWNRMNFP